MAHFQEKSRMYYEPGKTQHGLPYDPFKSCVIPRPIGWISTISRDGLHNLAPFSQFQNLTFDPPYVMFAANQTTKGRRKDTVVNAEQTKEFVWNMASYELREAVNKSAEEVPPGVDEFDLAGVTKIPSQHVKPCRVAESPVHFECAYHQTIRLPGNGTMGTVDIVIGRVLGIHINDAVIRPDGKLDVPQDSPHRSPGLPRLHEHRVHLFNDHPWKRPAQAGRHGRLRALLILPSMGTVYCARQTYWRDCLRSIQTYGRETHSIATRRYDAFSSA